MAGGCCNWEQSQVLRNGFFFLNFIFRLEGESRYLALEEQVASLQSQLVEVHLNTAKYEQSTAQLATFLSSFSNEMLSSLKPEPTLDGCDPILNDFSSEPGKEPESNQFIYSTMPRRGRLDRSRNRVIMGSRSRGVGTAAAEVREKSCRDLKGQGMEADVFDIELNTKLVLFPVIQVI